MPREDPTLALALMAAVAILALLSWALPAPSAEATCVLWILDERRGMIAFRSDGPCGRSLASSGEAP